MIMKKLLIIATLIFSLSLKMTFNSKKALKGLKFFKPLAQMQSAQKKNKNRFLVKSSAIQKKFKKFPDFNKGKIAKHFNKMLGMMRHPKKAHQRFSHKKAFSNSKFRKVQKVFNNFPFKQFAKGMKYFYPKHLNFFKKRQTSHKIHKNHSKKFNHYSIKHEKAPKFSHRLFLKGLKMFGSFPGFSKKSNKKHKVKGNSAVSSPSVNVPMLAVDHKKSSNKISHKLNHKKLKAKRILKKKLSNDIGVVRNLSTEASILKAENQNHHDLQVNDNGLNEDSTNLSEMSENFTGPLNISDPESSF